MSFQNDENNIFREVDQKADIVRVVSNFLGSNNVQKKGRIYVSLCPFHNDTNPSMQIDPNRNTFHCWACGSKGGSIAFVKKYKNIKPMEALKEVASICSIPLPDRISSNQYVSLIEQKFSKELKALNDAAKFYQLSLASKNGTDGREYLEKRGLPKEIIEHFGIGYAPSDPKMLVNALRSQGYDVSTLSRAGILSSSSELEDRYQDRIMFPIEDNSGHLVAFSGRILKKKDGVGKYVNYPETPLFKKAEILYHFSKAKEEARRKGYLYIVEGFMDVIAVCRAGCFAVCGTMGTALTEEHLKAIMDLGVEVRLCLDSDEPGQIGEERAAKELLRHAIPFRIVRKFTCGKDADEVLSYGKEKGGELLFSQLERLYDPFLFFLRRTLGERKMLTDAKEIQKFLVDHQMYFASLDAVSQEQDLNWLSKVCSLSKETLSKVLKNVSVKTEWEPRYPAEEARYQPIEDNNGKRPWRPYRRRQEPSYVINCTWSDNFMLPDIILQLNRMTKESMMGQGINASLLANECSIVMVLTHAYSAFELLESAKIDFAFEPFHYLVNLIGLEYLSHPGKREPFHPADYESLKSKIIALKDSSKQAEEEDDPLGLFVDEEAEEKETANFQEDYRDFLLSFQEGMRRLPSDCYDENAHKQNLTLHPLYYNLNRLQAKKRISGVLSDEEEIEIITLMGKIRKNSGTF